MKRLYIYSSVFIFFCCDLFTQDINTIKQLITKEQYQTIIDNYSSYETLISSYPEISYYLAVAYFKTQNYQKAEFIFHKLYKLRFRLAQTCFNLGITKYKLKKFNEAIKYLQIVKDYDLSLSAESMYVMIACYLNQDEKSKAIELYQELFEKFPNSLQVLKTQELFEKYGLDFKKDSLYSKPPKINFYLSIDYGYDNNINMVSVEQVSGNSDTYYGITTVMLLNYKQFTLLPSFEKILFSSFTSYNVDTYNLALELTTAWGRLSIFGREIRYQQPFSYDLGGSLQFSLLSEPLSRLKLYYSNKIYPQQKELNSTLYQACLNVFTNRKQKSSVGICIKRNLSEPIFSYTSFIPSVQASEEIFRPLKININLSYEIKNYDWGRSDKLLCLNISSYFDIIKNLQLSPTVIYTDCLSNKNYLSYQKTEVFVSLNLQL